MDQLIIYPLLDGIAIMYPCSSDLSIQDIALKDVPKDTPYLIIDADKLDDAHDFSRPDGYGMGAVAWFCKKIDADIEAVRNAKDLPAVVIMQMINQLEQQKQFIT